MRTDPSFALATRHRTASNRMWQDRGGHVRVGLNHLLPTADYAASLPFRIGNEAARLNPVSVGHLDDRTYSVSDSLAGRWHSGIGGSSCNDWNPVSVGGNGNNYLLGLVQPGIAALGLTPQIFVHMLGANTPDTTDAATRQLTLIDYMGTLWPTAWIVACTRTPQIANTSSTVNPALLAGIATRVATGARVSAFDVFPLCANDTTHFGDGLHPTELGYKIIGQAIAQYIVTGLSKGTFT
jgi:hypothetical protein